MNTPTKILIVRPAGFVMPLVLVVMIILVILAIGETMTSYSSRIQAIRVKAETEAMLAAEAGYEKAIFWMSQQTDILGAIQAGGGTDDISFGSSRCHYVVSFADFMGARPVFNVAVTGISGRPSFTRIVNVNVMQETSGWAMGACRIPNGTSSTTAVYFGNGEVINMPLHINNLNDSPDLRDIWISSTGGNPRFIQKVEMGEPRKTSGGSDKYSGVMSLFEGGITFDQPGIRITDSAAVQSKINRFRDSTAAAYKFTPADANTNVSSPRYAAVQLEFFVEGGIGKVRITNNCTVQAQSAGTNDYSIVAGSNPMTFQKYNIYKYHYRPTSGTRLTVPITDTYVTQQFGGYESDPGGQIYVTGNVVIGSCDYNDMIVKGKITVVATGNIWIADSIKVDDNGGAQRDVNGMPTTDNPNVLGLIAQGVIKVVDPGLGDSPTDKTAKNLTYQAIGNTRSGHSGRWLPNPTVVEAAITVGGGGWGAENTPNRRIVDSLNDDLYVRGSITEVVRGIIGHLGADGYLKHYYADTRLMSGILPGDIWFSGKYIPAPAGWHDYSNN
jgi:hypothetical protein